MVGNHQSDIQSGDFHGVSAAWAFAYELEFIYRIKKNEQGQKTQSGKPDLGQHFLVNHIAQCSHALLTADEAMAGRAL